MKLVITFILLVVAILATIFLKKRHRRTKDMPVGVVLYNESGGVVFDSTTTNRSVILLGTYTVPNNVLKGVISHPDILNDDRNFFCLSDANVPAGFLNEEESTIPVKFSVKTNGSFEWEFSRNFGGTIIYYGRF